MSNKSNHIEGKVGQGKLISNIIKMRVKILSTGGFMVAKLISNINL